MTNRDRQFVHIGGYKEPLRPVKDGHGYLGVLLYDPDKDKVQCHVCGDWFDSLASHVRTHKFETALDYKLQFGLARDSKLLSEGEKNRRVATYQKWARANGEEALKRKQMLAYHSKKWRGKATKDKSFSVSLEKRNKMGNCPDQILDKINNLAVEIGQVPSQRQFAERYHPGLLETARHLFGSWKKAVSRAKLQPLQRGGQGKILPSYTKSNMIKLIKAFYKLHKRTFVTSDIKRGLLPTIDTFHNWWPTLNDARKEAGVPLWLRVGGAYGNEYAEMMPTGKNN